MYTYSHTNVYVLKKILTYARIQIYNGQTRRTNGRTNRQTDEQMDGKPIVPSSVNTGRGLINWIIIEGPFQF